MPAVPLEGLYGLEQPVELIARWLRQAYLGSKKHKSNNPCPYENPTSSHAASLSSDTLYGWFMSLHAVAARDSEKNALPQRRELQP